MNVVRYFLNLLEHTNVSLILDDSIFFSWWAVCSTLIQSYKNVFDREEASLAVRHFFLLLGHIDVIIKIFANIIDGGRADFFNDFLINHHSLILFFLIDSFMYVIFHLVITFRQYTE